MMEPLVEISMASKSFKKENSDCVVHAGDSVESVRKRCKTAFRHGEKTDSMWKLYNGNGPNDMGPVGEDYATALFTGVHGAINGEEPKRPVLLRYVDIDSGLHRSYDDYELDEVNSSTERVRRYYKRHPEKVRKYLRDTVADRVARNRDRQAAIAKYGKAKMKNHDVHHPNGPHGGKWVLAKKDHGPDKKHEGIVTEEMSRLSHPFENENLTFGDMKKILSDGLIGDLNTSISTSERLDGDNVAFSVKNKRIVFARNKGHVKMHAENALDTAGMVQMFAGRSDAKNAFISIVNDLQKTVDNMSATEVKSMFAKGSKFMTVNMIFPDKNVIPYGKTILIFHETIEYDNNANEINDYIEDGRVFSRLFTRTISDAQREEGGNIRAAKTIVFNDAETEYYNKKLKKYIDDLNRLVIRGKLTDSNTLSEYRENWWRREIPAFARPSGITLSNKEIDGLVDRWANENAADLKFIEDDDTKKWINEFEKNRLKMVTRRMISPIDSVFVQAGIDTLSRVINTLSANNPALERNLKNDLMQVISHIKDSDDIYKIPVLQTELKRLKEAGIDKVIPSEGLVFVYAGVPHTLSGEFDPINQINSTFKFSIISSISEEDADDAPTKTVVVYASQFQPFHSGHYRIYKELVDRFGIDNTYLTTVKGEPFSFLDKQEIATQLFGIPKDKLVLSKNPYLPAEILKKQPDNTIFVIAVNELNAGKLGDKYFKDYDNTPESERVGYKKQGYFMVEPNLTLRVNGQDITSSQLRDIMSDSNITMRAKKEVFTKVYGTYESEIFKKMVNLTTMERDKKHPQAMITIPAPEVSKPPKASSGSPSSPDIPLSTNPFNPRTVADRVRRSKLLRQRIVNPETGREIFVGTALAYDKDKAVRRDANALLQRLINNSPHSSPI